MCVCYIDLIALQDFRKKASPHLTGHPRLFFWVVSTSLSTNTVLTISLQKTHFCSEMPAGHKTCNIQAENVSKSSL